MRGTDRRRRLATVGTCNSPEPSNRAATSLLVHDEVFNCESEPLRELDVERHVALGLAAFDVRQKVLRHSGMGSDISWVNPRFLRQNASGLGAAT